MRKRPGTHWRHVESLGRGPQVCVTTGHMEFNRSNSIWMFHPSCLTAQPILPYSNLSRQNQAYSRIAKLEVNPTKVREVMVHSVNDLSDVTHWRCYLKLQPEQAGFLHCVAICTTYHPFFTSALAADSRLMRGVISQAIVNCNGKLPTFTFSSLFATKTKCLIVAPLTQIYCKWEVGMGSFSQILMWEWETGYSSTPLTHRKAFNHSLSWQ